MSDEHSLTLNSGFHIPERWLWPHVFCALYFKEIQLQSHEGIFNPKNRIQAYPMATDGRGLLSKSSMPRPNDKVGQAHCFNKLHPNWGSLHSFCKKSSTSVQSSSLSSFVKNKLSAMTFPTTNVKSNVNQPKLQHKSQLHKQLTLGPSTTVLTLGNTLDSLVLLSSETVSILSVHSCKQFQITFEKSPLYHKITRWKLLANDTRIGRLRLVSQNESNSN